MVEPATIAIINTSPDVVEMLRDLFHTAGFLAVSCFTHDVRDGRVDLDAFLRQHQPRVIVYDIAPPYELNVRLFEHVRAMPAVNGRQFVLTSVNPANLVGLVGRDDRVYEVVDRAEDLLKLVQAVKEASRARAIR